jgi:hypothetical protein
MKIATSVAGVCFSIIVLCSLVHAQNSSVGMLAGTWSGKATGGAAKSYSVTVSLNGTGTGFVEYPSMKCGGTLKFVRKSGDSYSYHETITHGQARCGAAGQIDMSPDGSNVAWARTSAGNRTTATLTNTDNPDPNGCASCEMNYDQSAQQCERSASPDDRQKCLDHAEDDLHMCEGNCRS